MRKYKKAKRAFVERFKCLFIFTSGDTWICYKG